MKIQRRLRAAGARGSAQQRVLFSVDTLHLILQDFDEQFILTVAQRVCKDWHFLINHDKHFKARLFLGLPKDTHSRQRVINPLLCERFPHFFGTYNIEHGKLVENKSAVALDWYKSLARDAEDAAQSPLLYPQASWRRMHITNPPTMRIFDYGVKEGFNYNLDLTIKKYPKGLRMEDLYKHSLPADPVKFGDQCQRIEWPLGLLFRLPEDLLDRLPPMQYATTCTFDEVLTFAHPMHGRFERSLQTMAQNMEEYGIEYSHLQLVEDESRRSGLWLVKILVPRVLNKSHRRRAAKSLRSAYRKLVGGEEEVKTENKSIIERAGFELLTQEQYEQRDRRTVSRSLDQ